MQFVINMILVGQVNIPSWGQLGCTQVPRPFLLTAKGLVPRLTKYLVGKMISLLAPGAVDKAVVWSCSNVWPTCNSLKAFSGWILFRMHCMCKATFPTHTHTHTQTFLGLLILLGLDLLVKVYNLPLHLSTGELVQHEVSLLLLGPPGSPFLPEPLLAFVSPPLPPAVLPHEVQDPPQWQQRTVDEEKELLTNDKERLGVSGGNQTITVSCNKHTFGCLNGNTPDLARAGVWLSKPCCL